MSEIKDEIDAGTAIKEVLKEAWIVAHIEGAEEFLEVLHDWLHELDLAYIAGDEADPDSELHMAFHDDKVGKLYEAMCDHFALIKGDNK